jgi:hypothetical protein
MARTRAKAGAVFAASKGKRSGGRRARTTHYNALPESVRGSTSFYNQGRPRSRMAKIALRGSRRRTARNTARHAVTRQSRGRRVPPRHGHPTHRPRQGADKRKQGAYCLRAYKAPRAPRASRRRQRVVHG